MPAAKSYSNTHLTKKMPAPANTPDYITHTVGTITTGLNSRDTMPIMPTTNQVLCL